MAVPLLIEDAPRFTHRGLLVDTGRQYQTVPFLKKTIESMAMNKMNLLHWQVEINLLGFTENLLENTDGVLPPPLSPEGSEHPISVLSGRHPATFYLC